MIEVPANHTIRHAALAMDGEWLIRDLARELGQEGWPSFMTRCFHIARDLMDEGLLYRTKEGRYKRPDKAEVYCGAYTGPVMYFTEMPECGEEFVVTQDDPVEPSRTATCPKCGAECEVEWAEEYSEADYDFEGGDMDEIPEESPFPHRIYDEKTGLSRLHLEPRTTRYGCGIYEAGENGLRMFVTDSGRVMSAAGRALSAEDLMEVYTWGRIDAEILAGTRKRDDDD